MTITISPVKTNSNTQCGKMVGTTVGAGVATGYIAKNAKPLFLGQIPELAVESGLSKKVGYAASGAAAVIVSAGIIGAGRLIGAGIGKIVDIVKQKKQEKEVKEVLAETLQSNLKEVKTISLAEMEQIGNMSDEEANAFFAERMKQTSKEE